MSDIDFTGRLDATALAMRGYDVTNLGKSPELLAHPAYGRTVEKVLRQVSQLCADTVGRKVDLVAQVKERRETTLDGFPEAVALIVGMEIAQLRLLDEFFGIDPRRSRLTFGYSIGELTCLVLGGVFTLEQLLPIPMGLADDCAAMADQATMGILFSRGPLLHLDHVRRLCVRVSSRGRGLVAPSAYLAPNTVLLLAQGDRLDEFQELMKTELPDKTYLRRNRDKWPPMHTPLLWEKCIPNRTAVRLFHIEGGMKKPEPALLSMVTGKFSYNDHNAREILIRWVDHPQHLWDVVYETLATGIEVVVHVGPAPNLVPATYSRLASNVTAQVGGSFLSKLGQSVLSNLATERPWLASLLSNKAALLRAPFVEHVILEDWLLAQKP